MDVTVTLDRALRRTMLILPEVHHQPRGDAEKTTGDQELNVRMLRRSLLTNNIAQRVTRDIVVAGGNPIARTALHSTSIPTRQPRAASAMSALGSPLPPRQSFSNSMRTTTSSRHPSMSMLVPHPDFNGASAAAPQSALGIIRALIASREQSLTPSLPEEVTRLDQRPPSRSNETAYRVKIRKTFDRLLRPEDTDVPVMTHVYPDNIMIPAASRYPELVYPPAGVVEVQREVASIRSPPPTHYVRQLQKSTVLEPNARATSDTLADQNLRPQSGSLSTLTAMAGTSNPFEELSPYGPAPGRPCSPTETTRKARKAVSDCRGLLQVTAMESSRSSIAAIGRSSSSAGKFGRSNSREGLGRATMLRFRKGIVQDMYNS